MAWGWHISGRVPVITTRSKQERTPGICSAYLSVNTTMAVPSKDVETPTSTTRGAYTILSLRYLFGSGYAGLGPRCRATWDPAHTAPPLGPDRDRIPPLPVASPLFVEPWSP